MEFSLPFNDDVVDAMTGKTMVVAENHRNSNIFKKMFEAKVDAGDIGYGWSFQIERKGLRMIRDGKLFCEFTGLESKSGNPYAIGYRADVEAQHGFDRVVLYEKKTITQADMGICISSHISYREKTVEPILKSLRKTGFDMSRVVVVVDGDKEWRGWQDERADDVKVFHHNADAMGFAGLLGLGITEWSSVAPYWLLVHDTCAFERDFMDRVQNVDVGLNPDIVLLYPPEQKKEMGLYSTDFVKNSRVDIEKTKPGLLFDAFMTEAQVVISVDSKVEVLGEKDVYGLGIKRKTIRLASLGLRKHEGKDARGGKP